MPPPALASRGCERRPASARGLDPARPAGPRRRGGGARARGAALREAVAGPAAWRVRAGIRGAGGGAHASAVSSGTAGLHLALRAVGVSDGDEVDHDAVLVRGKRQRRGVRAGPPGVRRHRSGDAEPRSRRGGRRGDEPHGGVAAGARVRLPGRHLRASSGSACRSSRTHARPSARCPPTASRSAARGHPAVFGFYANKQLTTGEGGMVTIADAAIKERIDSERNQGRAPDMGWLDHDRLGFNYRLSDIACALGLAQLERLERCSPGVPGWPSSIARRSRGSTGLELPCADAGGNRRGWFVFVVQLPAESTATSASVRSAELGIPSKPYFPAVHLMSYYRERFGHREGEFPVCEDVAARSIALPFFPRDERRSGGAGGGGAAPRFSAGCRRAAVLMSRFAEPQDADFRALNDSIAFDRRLGPYDVEQSRAHATMLAAQADHLDLRARRAAPRARSGRARAARRIVPVRRRATRTSTWRSSGA